MEVSKFRFMVNFQCFFNLCAANKKGMRCKFILPAYKVIIIIIFNKVLKVVVHLIHALMECKPQD